MLRSLQKFSRIEFPAATSWVGVGEGWKKIVEETKA
jgi:hypothetical protein